MKKIIANLLLATAMQFMFIHSTTAQLFAKDGPQKKMQVDIFRSELFPEVIAGNEVATNSKILKNFKKNYASVSLVDWFEVDNLIVARFQVNGKNTKVYYTPKGEEFAVVSTYSEKLLPSEIRKLVKSTYYDFNITQIIEITAEGKTAYLLQMEDESKLLTVRIIDMEMSVYSEYNKSK